VKIKLIVTKIASPQVLAGACFRGQPVAALISVSVALEFNLFTAAGKKAQKKIVFREHLFGYWSMFSLSTPETKISCNLYLVHKILGKGWRRVRSLTCQNTQGFVNEPHGGNL
jgi:hypothetical protein